MQHVITIDAITDFEVAIVIELVYVSFSLSQLLLKSAVSQLHGKMVLCKFPCR